MLLNFFGSVLNIDMDKSCIVNAFRIGKVSRPPNIPLNSTNMGSPTRDDGGGSVAWFGETRPRPIFVKLSSGFLKNDIMRARAKLKKDDRVKDVYINEDLTSHRRKMLHDLRNMKKDKRIMGLLVVQWQNICQNTGWQNQ